MAKVASVILLLIVAVAYLPSYESAVIRHELEKRQADSRSGPTKQIYNFRYKNDDNSYREEVGKLLNPGTENEILLVEGEYGFEINGKRYVVKFTADNNGYLPVQQSTSITGGFGGGGGGGGGGGVLSLSVLKNLAFES